MNGYLKVTHDLDSRSHASLTLVMAYGGSWNASGALPARAICGEGDGTPRPLAYSGSNCVSRWDSFDPSQGGASERFMAAASYEHRFDGRWQLEGTLYALRSNLQLFPNDGVDALFQPDGMQYGSQIEQDDTRTQSGADFRLTQREHWHGLVLDSAFGLQFRDDGIEAQLHRTEGRKRLDGVDAILPGPEYDSAIQETEIGAYFEEHVRLTRWLRIVVGLREDQRRHRRRQQRGAAGRQRRNA